MSKSPLFLAQPLGVVGEVREDKVADNSDDKCGNALKDKEPLPTSEALYMLEIMLRVGGKFRLTHGAIHAMEDTSGDQSSKSSS